MPFAPEFKSLGKFTVPGRGLVHVVACDKERPRDDTGLVGMTVVIDGEAFHCRGVERRLPSGPIREGEEIGLLVGPPRPLAQAD
jgi:hypothetical protein